MTADPTTDVASKARDGLTYPVINFCTTHRELMLPVSDDTILLEIGERGVVDRSRHPNVLNCFEEAPITRNYRAELAVVSGVADCPVAICAATLLEMKRSRTL